MCILWGHPLMWGKPTPGFTPKEKRLFIPTSSQLPAAPPLGVRASGATSTLIYINTRNLDHGGILTPLFATSSADSVAG